MTFKKGQLSANPKGRRAIRLSAEQLDEVVKAVAAHHRCPDVLLAHLMRVDPDTFRAMRKRDPRIAKAVELGRAMNESKLNADLMRQSERGAVGATIFGLKQHGWRDDPAADVTRPTVVINLPGSADPAAYAKLIQPAAIEGETKPEGDDDGSR